MKLLHVILSVSLLLVVSSITSDFNDISLNNKTRESSIYPFLNSTLITQGSSLSTSLDTSSSLYWLSPPGNIGFGFYKLACRRTSSYFPDRYLVARDSFYVSTSEIVWQSFDHPINNILGGQNLSCGVDLISVGKRSKAESRLSVQCGNGLVTITAKRSLEFGQVGAVRSETAFILSDELQGPVSKPIILMLDTTGDLYLVDSSPSLNGSSRYWLSPSGNIAFGFYKLACNRTSSYCPDRYVLCIWFVKSSLKTLVWTSNGDDLHNPSSIYFTKEGNLVLRVFPDNKEKRLIPDIKEPLSYGVMQDDDILVFYNSTSEIVWQSSDHPTITFLGGQNLSSGDSRLTVQGRNGLVSITVKRSFEFGQVGAIRSKTVFILSHELQGPLMLDTAGDLYLVDSDGVRGKDLYLIGIFFSNDFKNSSFSPSLNGSSRYWLSPSGNITFGFYKLACAFHSSYCPDRYVAGIWFLKSSFKSLVWTSNGDDLRMPSSIHLTSKGNLVLRVMPDNKEKRLIPDMKEPVSFGVLQDDGNLVFYGSTSQTVRQSFDHPTDAFIRAQNLRSSEMNFTNIPSSPELHGIAHFSVFEGSPRWTKSSLTYSLSPNFTIDYIPQDEILTVLRSSFGRWAAVVELNFTETKDYPSADIKIGFYRGDHGDGLPFVEGILAHAFAPEFGEMHFNADVVWSLNFKTERRTQAFDLESIATHEIGHLLGLNHSKDLKAIMYCCLSKRTVKRDLTEDDILGIQSLYTTNPHYDPRNNASSDDHSISLIHVLVPLLITGILVFVSWHLNDVV